MATPQELLNEVSCYACAIDQAPLLQLALLRRIAIAVGVSEDDLTSDALLSSAAASCLNCNLQMYPLLSLALLNAIADNTA